MRDKIKSVATGIVAMVILSGTLAPCGLFSGLGISCEAKETGAAATAKQEKGATAGEEQEVVAFVTAYYEAMTPEKIETLTDYVDDPEDSDIQKSILQQQIMFKHGLIGWENMDVAVCPMSDGKHWLASLSFDMIVEDFDVGIPGLIVLLVGRNEAGELKIISNSSELSEEFIAEMRELNLSDEMIDRNNEVAVAYNSLLGERPDIAEWLLEINDVVTREMGETLAREEGFSAETDSEKEKSGAKKGSYIVKKGDCLWDIAEKQLGDGMRWSDLYEENRAVIGEDPNLIYVGIELQLK